MQHKIILFYKYTNIKNPELLMEREKAVCEVLDLKGRIIIAEEGLNGTLEGTTENIDKYIKHIHSDKKFKLMDIKWSEGTGSSFPKLSIRVRDEIVGQKLPKRINPNKLTGIHLPPHELHKWYREGKDDFVIVDMRSKYETMCGVFDKTIDIDVDASRDLVKSKELETIKKAVEDGKKIITVCTGGVKCERMSGYLIDLGIEKKNVYQLHNGIHAYMQEFPGEDFAGTLYTFDGRKTMHFGGENRRIYGKCYKCSIPCEEVYDVYEEDGHEYQRIVCDNCVKDIASARRGNVYRNRVNN
ncbi:MAG: hypothetical protein QG614_403 [Patescibacteria group bacterium]|nr:hypothetical protein [Patescibacteria group bacterium]